MTAQATDHSAHRLVQFSDGVFTVALTLLVIDIAVPTLPNSVSEKQIVDQLVGQIPNIEAFLLTFWVVGLYWLTHHRHFQFIRRYDSPLLLLNLLLLMTVCFIPWPTAVLGHYGDYFAVWVLYALSMAAMGFATAGVWAYASGKANLVDGVTPELRRFYLLRALVQPLVFLASIPIAAVSLSLGQLSWVAIFVVLFFLSRRFRDRVEQHHRVAV